MDASSQIVHVTNQAVIYDLTDSARSRLTTVYMTTYFLGGAARHHRQDDHERRIQLEPESPPRRRNPAASSPKAGAHPGDVSSCPSGRCPAAGGRTYRPDG
jgi:hypothetical protein